MSPVICKECGGDGFFLYDGGPGRFCAYTGNWLPFEVRVACEACQATGLVDEAEPCGLNLAPNSAPQSCADAAFVDEELPF